MYIHQVGTKSNDVHSNLYSDGAVDCAVDNGDQGATISTVISWVYPAPVGRIDSLCWCPW
jgi:hypothetical protein